MFTKKNPLLWLAIAMTFTGCGGSDSPAPVPTPSSGKVIDGYLVGSTMVCDVNKNGVYDSATETTTITGAGGAFTFAAGCSSTIVATGGTDETTGFAFKGVLKSPAGSPVATPLTTLVSDTGMTAAQLATALGLPAGTDVTQIDPADGKHQDLLKTTLAVQQIIQQMSNMFASLGGSTDIGAMYSKVAAAVAASLLANPGTPLLSTDGTVNLAAMNTLASGALAAVKSDTRFGTITISASDLTAAVGQITAQAQKFRTASDADLANLTSQLQNPAAPKIEVSATSNYLALSGDAVKINGTAISYATLLAGATIATPSTFGLDFSIKGTPVINTVSSLALELKEVDGQSRVLQMMIDKVNINSVNGQLSIVPDASAKVFVFGHTSSGNDINLTLNDLSFKPLTVTNNSLTVNYSALVKKVLASVDNTTSTTAQKFIDITGNFNIKVAVDGLPVRTIDGSAALSSTAVTVEGSFPLRSVKGVGASGKLFIQ
jgi:hypothetical protein